MSLVVLDTNVAIRSVVGHPHGRLRKLWALLAYGALAHRVEQLQLEIDALLEQHSSDDGMLVGADRVAVLVENAEAGRRIVEDVLPMGTPSELVLAGSGSLFDEFLRNVPVLGERLKRDINEREALRLLRQYQALCVATPDPLYPPPDKVPTLTTDPDDDIVVFDSLRVRADFLVTDDRDVISRDQGDCRRIEHDGMSVLAVRSDYFLESFLDDVDWAAIDPEVIDLIARAMSGRLDPVD